MANINTNYITNTHLNAVEEDGYASFWIAEEEPALADFYSSNPYSSKLEPESRAAWARGFARGEAEAA